MKNIYIVVMALCLPTFAYAFDLDTPITPEKNMTEGGVFSSPEEVPALEGEISAIKEAKKVFIPYFKVKFEKVMHSSAKSESGNWRSSASAKMHANVETTGYKEEVFQKITDLAYEDLANKLKAKGFEVISREKAKASSDSMKNETEEAKKVYPNVEEDDSLYVASDTSFPEDSWMAPLAPDGSLNGDPSHLSNELEAGLIIVGYDLSYVNVTSKESSSMLGASVEISLGPVANAGGFMQVSYDGDFQKLTMGQVSFSEIPFGHLEESTSTGTKAALAGVAVLGALMGSGSSLDITDYTLTVDEGKFVEASVDALTKANEIFINSL
ncbi:MAG: hypothetical protein R8M14_04570 [Ghiorsea sp.]